MDSNDATNKDTNPKDAVGVRKVGTFSCLPAPVLFEASIAMLEGGRRYGRHNYRVAGVRASVYYDACLRNILSWWEGEDLDPDTGLSHVTKAITSLMVLRDAMIQKKWTDAPRRQTWLLSKQRCSRWWTNSSSGCRTPSRPSSREISIRKSRSEHSIDPGLHRHPW